MNTRTISKIIAVLIIMAICTTYVMLKKTTDQKPYNSVDNEKAKELLHDHAGKTIIIDVRTADEYATGHLPDAINIDVKTDSFQQSICKFKEYPVVLIYCRSGRRSKQAASIIAEKFTSSIIYELDKGILGWDGDIVTEE